MGLWILAKGLTLLANGLAIVSEDRVLAPRGWTLFDLHQTARKNSLKAQFIGLINACQYMKLPLIVINVVFIGSTLIFG